MRDSIGSIYPLVIVISFIVLMSGFLAFSVNYNKAFRTKNRIIYILEKYGNDPTNSEAQAEIKNYANEIGYNASKEYTLGCDGVKFVKDGNNTGWCYNVVTVSSDTTNGSGANERGLTNGAIAEYKTTYVNVKTFVSIDVPIFNKLFSKIKFFTVSGSTKQITTLNR